MSSEHSSNGTSSINGINGANGATASLEWARLQRVALLAGAIGLAVYAVLGLTHSALGESGGVRQFFLSFLTAWVFWISLPIGCMALIGIELLTGASWGVLLRRLFEAATRTLPLMIVLFVPLAASLFVEKASPYPWSRPAEALEQGDSAIEELQKKFDEFCNAPFFLARVGFYFCAWGLFIFFLNKWGKQVEQTNDPKARRYVENMAGPMVMFFGLGNMFASTDFVMSLELHWSSTMFPVIYSVNQMLTALCFCVAVFLTLSTQAPLNKILRPKFQIDMGSLMLALTMVWSYTSFAQYLLIWVANLPEEIPFFLKRTRGGWEHAAMALCVLHFALPFLLLLFRDVKLHPKRLRGVAIGLLVLCALDVLWWIEPVYPHENGPLFLLMDFAAIIGMGGIWGWVFLGQLKKYPLLPTNYLDQLPRADHAH